MTIYYWKGATGGEKLLQDHQKSVQKLLERTYASSDLEKLKTTDLRHIYSLRLTKKARLLFTEHMGCLHLLEYLPNHEYSKSKFLKKGILTKYLEHISFSPLDKDELIPVFKTDEADNIVDLEYYNQQFVCLSDEQRGLISHASLPLILHAEAGSGKTLLSTIIMAQQTHPASRVLYVTEESGLVEKTRLNYLGLCVDNTRNDKEEGNVTAEFKTYNEIIAPFCQITSNALTEWNGTLKASAHNYSETELYQEFRVCSGFSSEDYCRLGDRQSSIPREKRAEFYALYQRYLAYLEHTKQYDPTFYAFDCEPVYDLIVVDEALRFSLHQLLQLGRLAKHHSVIYCIDSNQNMMDTQPIRVLLEQLLQPYHVRTERLSQQYRYSTSVVQALNKVLALKRLLVGGKIDKQEVTEISSFMNSEQGEFHVVSPRDFTKADNAWMEGRDGHLAIVTIPELLEEAEEVFETPLIFTPEQIQGQEFHTIVVYKYLASLESKKALLKLDSLYNQSSPKNRAKAGESNPQFSPWISSYFTACSRARNTLILMEESDKKNHAFLKEFKILNTAKSERDSSKKDAAKDCSTQKASIEKKTIDKPVICQLAPANWTKILENQQQLGNTKVVEKIKKMRLSPGRSNQKPSRSDIELGHDLMDAIVDNDIDKMEEIIKNPNCDLNFKYTIFNITQSPITLAITLGHSKALEKLLSYSDRVDLNGYCGKQRPLELAMTTGTIGVLNLLCKFRHLFDMNPKDELGRTPLITSCFYGHTDRVKALIAYPEVDLNWQDKKNSGTALIYAIQNQSTEIVRSIVSYEERLILTKRTHDGHNALMVASHIGNMEIMTILLECDSPAQLGFNCRRLSDGLTALYIAATRGFSNVVALLLEKGSEAEIDVNYKDNQRADIFEFIKDNSPKPEVISVLLDDKRILNGTINYIINNPTVMESKNTLGLMVQLIKKREVLIPMINSGCELNLNTEEHANLLQNLIDSHEKSDSDQHPLYKILFKIRRQSQSLFQNEARTISEMIATLREILMTYKRDNSMSLN